MDSKTKVCGLIGYPIEHSVSPQMHNAGFSSLGLNYIYLAFSVPNGWLRGALEGARFLQLRGLNVTTPHKIAVVKFLDQVDVLAGKIGAVNTILNEGGRLIGFNTDSFGVVKAIGEEAITDKNVLIIGAGGAARAIAFGLSEKASRITILNRDVSKAVVLGNDLRAHSQIEVDYGSLNRGSLPRKVRESDVIVNATTVGMYPHSDETVIDGRYISEDKVVFDAVYNPVKTKLIREAESRGAKTVYGYEMLLYQGAESFRIWTGENPPLTVMRNAILRGLRG